MPSLSGEMALPLSFMLLEALDHHCISAAIFGKPFTKDSTTYPMLSAQIGIAYSRFVLFQNRHDLAVGKFCCLHAESPAF